MAIDVNLNIYTSAHNHIKLVHLYFGQKLTGLGAKFEWIESIGMSVDGPSAYEDGAVRHDGNVTKALLKTWIDKGYLGRYPNKNDSSEFLDGFPDNTIFNLWFVDWS